MKTRNPIEGYFVVNFRRSVIIAELWRPQFTRRKFFLEICECFGKTTPCGKIFEIRFRKFSSWHWSMRYVQIWWNWANCCRNCALLTWQKNQNFPNCCYCPDRARNLPGQPQTIYSECFTFHPNRFTFSRVSVERVCLVAVCQPVLKYLGPIDRPPKRAVLWIQYSAET